MLKLVVTVAHTNVISISVNHTQHVTNYWVSSINQALSWLMLLVAGLSPRIPWTDTKRYSMALGQDFF
jgi:hypothetical protein